jgi:hypothetical protein
MTSQKCDLCGCVHDPVPNKWRTVRIREDTFQNLSVLAVALRVSRPRMLDLCIAGYAVLEDLDRNIAKDKEVRR